MCFFKICTYHAVFKCSIRRSDFVSSLFRYSRFVALTTASREILRSSCVPCPVVVLFSPLGASGDYHGAKIYPLQNRAEYPEYRPKLAKQALPSPASKLSSSCFPLDSVFSPVFLQFLLLRFLFSSTFLSSPLFNSLVLENSPLSRQA